MDPVKLVEQAFDATGKVVGKIDTTKLSAATPCAEWDARALLNHTVGVIRAFEGAATTGQADASFFAADNLGDDPAAAYASAAQATLAAWSTASLDREVQLPFGPAPAAAAANINALDTFLHGWDLAKAIGAPFEADDATCEALLAFARNIINDQVRSSGAFGAEVAVPADAPAIDRLAAFCGRTP